MLTSIQSHSSAKNALLPVTAMPRTHKAGSITGSGKVFGEQVAEARSTWKADDGNFDKILSRPDRAADRKLAAKSLTNRNLASPAQSVASKVAVAAAPAAPAPFPLAPKSVTPKVTVKSAAEDEVVTPPAPPPTPIEALSAALTAIGYDPSKFKMEMREEKVEYPGGSYMHRYTNVQLPNGTSENFTTDLMARYPTVTANEIRRLMENQQYSNSQVTVTNFNGGN